MLFTVCLVSLAAGLAGELGWRWFCVAVMDVAATLVPLQDWSLLVSAAVPVVGNGLGYHMTHRRYSSRSRLLYVGPSIFLTGLGLAGSLAQLPAAPGAGPLAATLVMVLITPIVTVTILLTRSRNLLRPTAVPIVRVPPAVSPSEW